LSNLPKILKEIRLEKGLTCADVAGIMDTTNEIIARWERGDNAPNLTSLERWANALGYELELMLKEPANVK